MAKKNTRTESLEVPITLADHPFLWIEAGRAAEGVSGCNLG